MNVLIYGGSGSGKSAFAEKLICSLPAAHYFYLATMECQDAETQQRIARHRAMRAERPFETIEQPRDLSAVALPPQSAGLLECLSNLLANELFVPAGTPAAAEAAVWQGIITAAEQAAHFVVVSNAVFSDGVVYDTMTTAYLEALDRLHCKLAQWADLVIEVVCGIPILQKGAWQNCGLHF